VSVAVVRALLFGPTVTPGPALNTTALPKLTTITMSRTVTRACNLIACFSTPSLFTLARPLETLAPARTVAWTLGNRAVSTSVLLLTFTSAIVAFPIAHTHRTRARAVMARPTIPAVTTLAGAVAADAMIVTIAFTHLPRAGLATIASVANTNPIIAAAMVRAVPRTHFDMAPFTAITRAASACAVEAYTMLFRAVLACFGSATHTGETRRARARPVVAHATAGAIFRAGPARTIVTSKSNITVALTLLGDFLADAHAFARAVARAHNYGLGLRDAARAQSSTLLR